jgi:hypothetical protein
MISDQGQQLIHHHPDTRFETRIGDDFAALDGHCQVARQAGPPQHIPVRLWERVIFCGSCRAAGDIYTGSGWGFRECQGSQKTPRKLTRKKLLPAWLAVNEKVVREVAKRKRTVGNFAAAPFEEPLAFAKQVFEFGSGESVRRLRFFDHISKAPDSGASRMLVTNANKYGLIKGNYASEILEMTSDGVRAVDPQIPPRDQLRARIKLAIEDIEVFAKLHERFVGKALPAKAALVDTAAEFGATKDAAEEAVDTFILNVRFVGLLATLSGAERVITKDAALDGMQPSATVNRTPTTQPAMPVLQGAIITADHAKFESTCFYITPIGGIDSEQRKHSDLFTGTLIEPALASFGLTVVRADQIDKPGMITKQIMEYLSKVAPRHR